jgi:hypothetical protein
VGPNNGGKAAVVAGLRALFTITKEGALRVDAYNLHASGDNTSTEMTLHYAFRDLTPDEEAHFLSVLKPMPVVPGATDKFEAHLWARYKAAGTSGRMRFKR